VHPWVWAAWTVSGDPGDLSTVEPVSSQTESDSGEPLALPVRRGVPPWVLILAGVSLGVVLALLGRKFVRRTSRA